MAREDSPMMSRRYVSGIERKIVIFKIEILSKIECRVKKMQDTMTC
jgi:hypothetical protein